MNSFRMISGQYDVPSDYLQNVLILQIPFVPHVPDTFNLSYVTEKNILFSFAV